MGYVGEFRANIVVYRFCEVLSYKKWTLYVNRIDYIDQIDDRIF